MRYNSLWLWRWLPHRLSLSASLLNLGLHSPGRSKSTYLWNVILASSSVTNSTVEPPLTPTSLQRPLFFGPVGKKSILWLLFKTSLPWPLSFVPNVAVVKRFSCIWWDLSNHVTLHCFSQDRESSSPAEDRMLWGWMAKCITRWNVFSYICHYRD